VRSRCFDALRIKRYNGHMGPFTSRSQSLARRAACPVRRHRGQERWHRYAPHYAQQDFEALVAEALDSLPDDIQNWLDNVAVVVAEQPTPEQLARAGMQAGALLLGLYVGVPKTHRGVNYGEVMPDKIVIFQRPIEQMCRNPDEIREQVRRTVLHEIGHHFGMDECQLRDAGV